MALQDRQCKNVVTPQKGVTKLFDSGGLFLQVDTKGRKYWRFQYYRPTDKKKDVIALGVYPVVTLKEARLKRDEAKLLLANGIDPKKHQQDKVKHTENKNSFELVAKQWHDNRKNDANRWSLDHAHRVIRSLEIHVFKYIGHKELNTILPIDILDIVKRIEEQGKVDTAHRVLDVIRQIFVYGVKMQYCVFNPASGLSSELATNKSTPFPHIVEKNKLTKLLLDIEAYSGTPSVRALIRLSPYVFSRPSEIRLMKWEELDLIAGVWSKEANNMKNKIAHVVPLSKQAIALISDLKPFSGHHEYVFWNNSTNKPVSEGASRKVLERLGYKGQFTPHGWRHTASTLLHDQGFNTLWIEAQLSHKDSNQIRGTYNHAQYLEQRRAMMQTWADYLDSLKAK